MKTIFISGVSSGIGLGLCKYALTNDWVVYGCSRRRPEIEEENFHFVSLDLEKQESIDGALKQLLNGAPELDLAVLNAGVLGVMSGLRSADELDMRKTMDVNLWSQRICINSLLNHGVKQVVGISSGASVNGNVGWGGYSLSKAALNMLIKLFASECPEVHFTALAPGLVDTSMQDIICGEVDDKEFPSITRIKAARGTEYMPTPDAFAPQFFGVLEKIKEHKSGAFVDVRKL